MSSSDAELAQIGAAERRGDPFLLYRDGHGRQQVHSLLDNWSRVTIGRDLGTDLVLGWDDEVSRVHANLERLGDDWVLVDEGLSRNGSFVNGERLPGRCRLRDGDELRFGRTVMRFRAPYQAPEQTRVTTQLSPKESES